MDNTIIVKKWYQKSYGNTYHSVRIGDKYSGMIYGYGRQYVQTTAEMLDITYDQASKLDYIVSDVKRKKDL